MVITYPDERGMTMNMNEIIAGVTLTKACSIKADKDSEESKVINLRVKFDGAQLKSVFDKALSGAVIAWQNGVGRKNYDTFKANQTVEIQFTSPAARAQVDPIDAIIAAAAAENIPVEQYLKREAAKRLNK